MKIKVTIETEDGVQIVKHLKTAEPYQDRNLNDFILDALMITESFRYLPFKIYSPNGDPCYPSIKIQRENFGSSIQGDKLKATIISWRD